MMYDNMLVSLTLQVKSDIQKGQSKNLKSFSEWIEIVEMNTRGLLLTLTSHHGILRIVFDYRRSPLDMVSL